MKAKDWHQRNKAWKRAMFEATRNRIQYAVIHDERFNEWDRHEIARLAPEIFPASEDGRSLIWALYDSTKLLQTSGLIDEQITMDTGIDRAIDRAAAAQMLTDFGVLIQLPDDNQLEEN